MTMYGYQEGTIIILLSAIGVLGVFGIVGNALSIVVWTRPQMRTSSTLLMTTLAATDILIILCTLIQHSWPFQSYYSSIPMVEYYSNFLHEWVRFSLEPIEHASKFTSMYLTLAITLERYIAVNYPFDYPSIWSYKRSCMSAALVTVVSILYNLIRYWEWTVVADNNYHGTFAYYYSKPVLKVNYLYSQLYLGWLDLFFRFLFPLAGIIAFNASIYRALEKASIARKEITDERGNEKRLFAMLIYIVCEFFICNSLNGFFSICNNFNISSYNLGFDLFLLIPVDLFFTIVNSSINFLTYLTFSEPFRKTFMKTFCGRKDRIQTVRPEEP